MTQTIKTALLAGLLAGAATTAAAEGEFVFIQDGVVLVMTENGAVPADAELAAKVQPLYAPMVQTQDQAIEAPLSAQPVMTQQVAPSQPVLPSQEFVAPEVVTQAAPLPRAQTQVRKPRLRLRDIWMIGAYR